MPYIGVVARRFERLLLVDGDLQHTTCHELALGKDLLKAKRLIASRFRLDHVSRESDAYMRLHSAD